MSCLLHHRSKFQVPLLTHILSCAARPELQLSRAQRASELELTVSLRCLLLAYVASWKTSAAEDVQLLARRDSLGSRERQAIMARLEYKRVMQACADLLALYAEHLSDKQ